MCGIALFSSKALGGLDPPAWSKLPFGHMPILKPEILTAEKPMLTINRH